MWWRILESFLNTRANKNRRSVSLGSLSIAEYIDEGSFQCNAFEVSGGEGQDDGLDLSCCDIVHNCYNMVKLGRVHCDGHGAGCQSHVHLQKPHLWPHGSLMEMNDEQPGEKLGGSG